MSGSNIARAGVLLLAALYLPGGATQAAVSSPFVAMAGSWSGGGVLSTTDGMQERLRCRASYGGAISGSWSEASRNASGTISGRAAGDHIEAAARGESFSANLSLTTRGGQQTVSIRPQGTNVTAVSIALNRR